MRAIRAVWLFGPAILYAGFIFWLSAQASVPGTPGGDKLAHFVAYAVMGGLFTRAAYFASTWTLQRSASVAASAAAIYGITDELHQLFVPGRSASVLDWAADASGSVVGSLVAAWFFARFMRRTRPGDVSAGFDGPALEANRGGDQKPN